MFNESGKGPFEVPPGCKKKINTSVPDDPKLYVLQENKIAFVFCSFSSVIYFIGDKITVDHFKDEITPSLELYDRLKFAQDVAMNCVTEKIKP